MKIHCVHCDQRIAIPEEYFGTIVTCPACQGGLKLPPLPGSAKEERPLVKLDPRLERFRTRFQKNGFRIDDASNSEDFPFLFNASKVRFEVMDTPNFLEEFFIFKEFPILDLQIKRGDHFGLPKAFRHLVQNDSPHGLPRLSPPYRFAT